jgi:hypothetical protein
MKKNQFSRNFFDIHKLLNINFINILNTKIRQFHVWKYRHINLILSPHENLITKIEIKDNFIVQLSGMRITMCYQQQLFGTSFQ